jgi:Spy/CpxP family protein refolding chaperone
MTGQRILAGVVLLSVFSLGAFVGIFVDRHNSLRDPAGVSPEEVHEAAMVELREELGLDEEQIQQIHAIMADRQELVQRIWEQLRPELQAAMTDVHAEIAALLRPEQRQRFHDWLQRRRQEAENDGEGVVIIPH